MITAFVVFFAGFFVFKKSVIFLLTLTALGGCGYKGALYIPEAPVQNEPAQPTSPTSTTSSERDNTVPASTSGELN